MYICIILCSSSNGDCLNDHPIGEHLNASALEGLNFDANAQCRATYGATARLCPTTFAMQVSLHNTSYYLYMCVHTVSVVIVVFSKHSNCVLAFGASLQLELL